MTTRTSPPKLGQTASARSSGQALYFQVYLALKERIFNGVYVMDAPLPTEDQLATEFGVSRITARRAMLDLAANGLVHRTPGRGTFLTAPPSLRQVLEPVNLEEQLRKTDADTRVEVLDFAYEKADARIARILGMGDSDAEVQHSRRLRFRGDQPVMVVDGYVPADIGRKFNRQDLKKSALHVCLERAGHPFKKLVQEFGAIAAVSPACDKLAVSAGTPLGLLERIGFDEADRSVAYIRIAYVPERARLRTLSRAGHKSLGADAGQFIFA